MEQYIVDNTELDNTELDNTPTAVEIFIIDSSINAQVLNDFSIIYNKYLNGEISYIHIYLCSDGGKTCYTDALLDMINQMGMDVCITAFGTIASSAFNLFYRATCPCRLLPLTVGMIHQSYVETYINELGQVKDPSMNNSFFKSYRKDYLDATIQLGEYLEFSKSETLLLRKGKDTWFSPNRMLELLNTKNNKIFVQNDYKPVYFNGEAGIA